MGRAEPATLLQLVSKSTDAYVLGDSMEVVAKLPSVDQRDSELKLVLKALSAFRRGEGGVTLPTEWDGVYGKIAAEFNELTAQAARTSSRLKSIESGPRTKPGQRRIPDEKLTGFWQGDVAAVNSVLEEVDVLSDHTRHWASTGSGGYVDHFRYLLDAFRDRDEVE